MDIHLLATRIWESAGDTAILEVIADSPQPALRIDAAAIALVCECLRNDPECYFDYLASISGVDYGNGTLAVIYHLASLPHRSFVTIKVMLPAEKPILPTVSHLWGAANWHEREAFDLLGIHFDGHPDLRRILLPDDWEGHPLRKDYVAQETYHGIRVAE